MNRFFLQSMIAFSLIIFCHTSCLGLSQPSTDANNSKPRCILVDVKSKPTDSNWKPFETRTLEQLYDFKPGQKSIKLCEYGGRTDKKFEAKGFFYPFKIKDRWWLIDPHGHPFVHVAIVGVYTGITEIGKKTSLEVFGSVEKWANFSTKLISDYGFNGTGGWSEAQYLRKSDRSLVYTLSWDFMGQFGTSKNLTYQDPGHLAYPNKCILVFHPDFEKFCDEYGKKLAETKGDPWLIGHFSDNELPIPSDLLDRSFGLDVNNPDLKYGYEAAKQWLEKRKGRKADLNDITDADRKDFIEYVYDRYYRITTSAIRKYDPNHLCIGARFNGKALECPEVFRAAGKYLDVISVNYYRAWTPDQKLMMMWYNESGGKPFMITEWYVKGADSGLANNSGAGWVVKTQIDRGRFYHNFVLGLMESKVCVGWHWFKYRDNDPNDTATDPSNRDSNKGIVDYKYNPYYPLLDEMKKLNENVYQLIDYFDSK